MPGRRNKQRLPAIGAGFAHWTKWRGQLAAVFSAFSEIFHVNIGFS
jgi:hypothetical protein